MYNLSKLFGTISLLIVLSGGLCGCQSTYYRAMEAIGFPKRDILVDRVKEAQESQEQAKEQFSDALDEFIAVSQYKGGELEKQYRTLKKEYDQSVQKADRVRERIDAVRDVAEALFDEWEDELEQYQDYNLKRKSAEQLAETQQRYERLISAMETAADKMQPVLQTFQDQVLFLKHNLNARAIASLSTEVASIEQEVHALIREMEASIAEANEFINNMEQ